MKRGAASQLTPEERKRIVVEWNDMKRILGQGSIGNYCIIMKELLGIHEDTVRLVLSEEEE